LVSPDKQGDEPKCACFEIGTAVGAEAGKQRKIEKVPPRKPMIVRKRQKGSAGQLGREETKRRERKRCRLTTKTAASSSRKTNAL